MLGTKDAEGLSEGAKLGTKEALGDPEAVTVGCEVEGDDECIIEGCAEGNEDGIELGLALAAVGALDGWTLGTEEGLSEG